MVRVLVLQQGRRRQLCSAEGLAYGGACHGHSWGLQPQSRVPKLRTYHLLRRLGRRLLRLR